ncbi:MAG: class I SAM-dependent methyltransferase [Rhodothermales bacterium]|nr:class I SAM-dependent methyltransferase [Rhodothermales bacterium]
MDAAYRDDLAYIHDVGFAHHAEAMTPAVLALLERHGLEGGCVVDLGCGSGRFARALADAGYEAVGVDLSPSMVARARARVPEGRFIIGSFFDADLPPCAAVTAQGEVFNYAFDPRNGLDALRALFRRVHAALRPGGLFLFDLAVPGRGAGPPKRFWTGPDWAVLVEIDETDGVLLRRITSFRAVDGVYRRSDEVHRQRLYPSRAVAETLRAVGFRARIVRRFGSYRLPRGLAGFIARRS